MKTGFMMRLREHVAKRRHDNVLPWLKQHGEFFNHEMVEAQTQAILSEVSMQQAQVATKH